MDNCKSCGTEYDYTERKHLVSSGILSNTTKCPSCDQLHRTDYMSSAVVIISFCVVLYAAYMLIELGPRNIYKNTKELSILAVGAVGVFIGFKLTRLVNHNET